MVKAKRRRPQWAARSPHEETAQKRAKFLCINQHQAAARLQSWYRRSLRVWVWDAHEIAPRPACWRPGIVRIVEPCGLAYDFNARSLALMFIAAGSAAHPVTRRAFLAVEVARTARALEPKCALLLRYTYKHSLQAQRAAEAQDSLEVWLHASAGKSLDALLLCAERGECPQASREEYEDAVRDVALQLPRQCIPLLRAHLELAERRQHCCDLEAWARVFDLISSLGRCYHYTARCARTESVPAFCWWLRQGLRSAWS
jgi:hypothetical protein